MLAQVLSRTYVSILVSADLRLVQKIDLSKIMVKIRPFLQILISLS